MIGTVAEGQITDLQVRCTHPARKVELHAGPEAPEPHRRRPYCAHGNGVRRVATACGSRGGTKELPRCQLAHGYGRNAQPPSGAKCTTATLSGWLTVAWWRWLAACHQPATDTPFPPTPAHRPAAPDTPCVPAEAHLLTGGKVSRRRSRAESAPKRDLKGRLMTAPPRRHRCGLFFGAQDRWRCAAQPPSPGSHPK